MRYNIARGDYMGKTSSAVKDRYNAKAYDEIKIRVPKGQKDLIQAHAEGRKHKQLYQPRDLGDDGAG